MNEPMTKCVSEINHCCEIDGLDEEGATVTLTLNDVDFGLVTSVLSLNEENDNYRLTRVFFADRRPMTVVQMLKVKKIFDLHIAALSCGRPYHEGHISLVRN